MRNFIKIAAGIEVLPVLLDLYRTPELWNQHGARTGEGGSFVETDDIWVRFRDPAELTSPEAFAELHVPVFYPAWYALPHLRPIVFGIMARVEAVQLGGILITRVPPGEARWRRTTDARNVGTANGSSTKAYLAAAGQPAVLVTPAAGRGVPVMGVRGVFGCSTTCKPAFGCLIEGASDRVTLIVSMRTEP